MEKKVFNEMFEVESRHWWFIARRKIIESTIKNLNPLKKLQILEAGCGNGDNLQFLSEFGDVVALEKDEVALANACSRKVGKVLKAELPNNIPTNVTKENDLIVMLDVLEHIDDDEGSLSVLKNYIKDNGHMIITVPAYQFLWSKHDETHHHERRYTKNKLRNIIETNGWCIEYISYFNTFLFPIAFLERLSSRILPLRKNSSLKVPPSFINNILKNIFSFESYFIGNCLFPFGLSIIVIARKI